MNTEQNYSAQDNCANTSEQPVVSTPPNATSKPQKATFKLDANRKTILVTVNKHQRWTHRIIDLLPNCRWITDTEKERLIKQLKEHSSLLDRQKKNYTENYSEGFLLSDELARSIIEMIHGFQANLNQELKWYEIPTLRLPKTIKPYSVDFFKGLSYVVPSDMMAPKMPKGASFYAKRIERKRWLRSQGVVLVFFHEDAYKSTLRANTLGRIDYINKDEIRLIYDNAKDKSFTIPMALISFIYKVKSVTQCFTLPVR